VIDTPGSVMPPDVVGLGVEVVGVGLELGFGLCVLVVDGVVGAPPPPGRVVVGLGAGAVVELVGAAAGVGAVVGVPPAAVVDDPPGTVDGTALGEADGTAVRVLSRETRWVSRGWEEETDWVGTAAWSCSGRCGATYVPTRTAA
jgi:hypothetical protein